MSSEKGLRIADDLMLPLETVTAPIAILAQRGSGKTYAAAVMVEEMVKAGLPTAVIDPIGVWWGLRSDAAGTGPGLPVVVFGGDHGDLPLDANAGEVVADALIDLRPPAVIDLSLLRKGEQQRFVMQFAERLYHRNRDPLHLVLDEADAWAPQRPVKGQERLLGSIEDLVRRGRARGLGCTLITQRPAVLHKDVLTQIQVLIALRMVAPHDREAIDAWVRVHGTPEQRDELMASLPSLPVGQGWIWSPGWLDLFQRITIRRRETFDSSATPKVGEVRTEPKRLAAVDLEALRHKIADTIERVEADDLKVLRRRIADLERLLRDRPAPERIVETVEVPVIGEEAGARITMALTNIIGGTEVIQGVLLDSARARGRIEALPPPRAAELPAPPIPLSARLTARNGLDGGGNPAESSMQETPSEEYTRLWGWDTDAEAKRTRAVIAKPRTPLAGAPIGLKPGQTRMLQALARRHPGRLTVPQLGALSRMAHKGGSFGAYLSEVQRAGLVDVAGDVGISDAGFAAIGEAPSSEPQSSAEALAMWRDKLPSGTVRVLNCIVAAYPDALDREELAERSGYAASGGAFGAAVGTLRRYGLVEATGGSLRASDVVAR